MAKVLVSPLFVALLVIGGGQVFIYTLWFQLSRRQRMALVFVTAATVVLALLSMPVAGAWLARSLESPWLRNAGEHYSVDVVTVLSAGYIEGAGPETDVLDEFTFARTWRGVEVFQAGEARLLVLQGSLGGREPARMVELMKKFAVKMGVPGERIALEPHSRNTFEHPLRLIERNLVHTGETLGVVTSAWHLPRAVKEFRRYFPRVVPIPADFLSYRLRGGLIDWVPQVEGLSSSTKVICEWIGLCWYWLRHRLSGQSLRQQEKPD